MDKIELTTPRTLGKSAILAVLHPNIFNSPLNNELLKVRELTVLNVVPEHHYFSDMVPLRTRVPKKHVLGLLGDVVRLEDLLGVNSVIVVAGVSIIPRCWSHDSLARV